MIISLGSILLKTEPRRNDTRDVAAMHVAGATSEDILKVNYAYKSVLSSEKNFN